MDKRDEILLNKIIEEVDVITKLIEGCDYECFDNDERTKRAVCMTLINIGELVKLLSDDLRNNNPSVPWRAIAGLRDVTAHGYQTLRMEDIWETIKTDTPKLRNQINSILHKT